MRNDTTTLKITKGKTVKIGDNYIKNEVEIEEEHPSEDIKNHTNIHIRKLQNKAAEAVERATAEDKQKYRD